MESKGPGPYLLSLRAVWWNIQVDSTWTQSARPNSGCASISKAVEAQWATATGRLLADSDPGGAGRRSPGQRPGPKAALRLAVAAGHMEAASRRAQSTRTPISAVDYYVFIMDASERARSLASDS